MHEEVIGSSLNKKRVNFLKKFIFKEKKDLLIIINYGVFYGIISLIIPITTQSLVNTIGFGVDLQPIFILSFIVFFVLAFSELIKIFQIYVMEIVQQRIFVNVAIEFAYKIPRFKLDALEKYNRLDLANRFFDTTIIQKNTSTLILDGVSLLLQTIFGMILLAFYHPFLLVFDLLIILSMGLLIFLSFKRGIETSIDESKCKYKVAAHLQEFISKPLIYKKHDVQSFAMALTDSSVEKYLNARKKNFQLLLQQIIGSSFIQVASNALLLGLGGWLVVKRQLTLGQLVAAELIMNTVLSGIGKFGKYLEIFYDLIAAADKIEFLWSMPTEIENEKFSNKEVLEGYSVQAKKINFLSHANKSLFNDLNFLVKSNEKICISGKNGSGKSILLDLIFKLKDLSSGVIEINDLDIRHLDLKKFRSDVTYISKEEIFNGTLLENLTLGNDIDVIKIKSLLKSFNILDDIQSLPDGLLTPIVNSKLNLPSGVIQKIILTRVLLSQPKMILIDQFLDQMDHDSFENVIKILTSSQDTPWTLILVSQRINDEGLMKNFNQHWIIENGCLIQNRIK